MSTSVQDQASIPRPVHGKPAALKPLPPLQIRPRRFAVACHRPFEPFRGGRTVEQEARSERRLGYAMIAILAICIGIVAFVAWMFATGHA